MNENSLQRMVTALIAQGLLTEAQRENAMTALRTCWQDEIAEVWTLEDVQTENTLTDAQARQVLALVRHNFDADIGINWRVLNATARRLFPGCEKDEDADV